MKDLYYKSLLHRIKQQNTTTLDFLTNEIADNEEVAINFR